MQFNPINLFGFIIVAIMLIPNIIYGIKFKGVENKCTKQAMNVIEQIGRYGSMAFMVLPLFIWAFYFKKETMGKAMALAVIPTCIFLLSGLTLYHWALVVTAVIFGLGHIYVTYQNNI